MNRLFEPVDASSLVFVRIAFAALLVVEVLTALGEQQHLALYAEPFWHAKFALFEWVPVWGPTGMSLHYLAIAVLATLLAFGLFTRPVTALLLLAYTHLFLMEAVRSWQNHLYLQCLLLGLLLACPVGGMLAADVKLGFARPRTWAPRWCVWALRFQVSVVYFYAALAKLEEDWLAGRFFVALASAYNEVDVEFAWGHLFLAWSGLAFDALVIPLLLWRKTRLLGFLACVVFHLGNAWLWDIGIFPWTMLVLTTVFFEPDWFRRALARLSLRFDAVPSALHAPRPRGGQQAAALGARARTLVLVLFCATQLLIPARVYLYPPKRIWHDQGKLLSWRMMLRVKAGTVRAWATDPDTGLTTTIELDGYLRGKEAARLCMWPEAARQMAVHIKSDLAARGRPNQEIHVDLRCGLNGRRLMPFIDTSVDLATAPRALFGIQPWLKRWDEVNRPE